MSGQVRPVDPLLPEPVLARRPRTSLVTTTAMVALLAVVSCIAFATATQHRKSALTQKEYIFARELVRSEVRKESAVLTSATVTVSYGKVIDSNIGYPCTSGRLLNIKLIGDFPHITTTGSPVQPGGASPDLTVHAVDLTADAKSGQPCLIGVQIGEVVPAPRAIPLPIN